MTREELLKYRLDGSKSFPFHIKEQEITDKYGVYSTGVFKYKGMSLIIAIENGLWHLSVSAKFPLGYQQLKDVRYKFLPNNIQVASRSCSTLTKTSCPMTEQRSMDGLSGSSARKSKDKLLIN